MTDGRTPHFGGSYPSDSQDPQTARVFLVIIQKRTAAKAALNLSMQERVSSVSTSSVGDSGRSKKSTCELTHKLSVTIFSTLGASVPGAGSPRSSTAIFILVVVGMQNPPRTTRTALRGCIKIKVPPPPLHENPSTQFRSCSTEFRVGKTPVLEERCHDSES